MAAPSYRSISTTAFATSNSVVITKPSGLAVGDLMIAGIFLSANSEVVISTPSGWNLSGTEGESGASPCNLFIFRKVADSADVAASDFTFSKGSGGAIDNLGGSIVCFDMDTAPLIFGEPIQSGSTSPTLSPSIAVVDSAALVMFIGVSGNNNPSAGTMSGYASTPTLTWTARAEIGSGVGQNALFAVATAAMSVADTLTAYTFTPSNAEDFNMSSLVVFTNTADATGTNTLVTTTSTTFTQSGTADGNTSNILAAASSQTFTQSGKATTPTQWNNEAKPSTSWTNETI